MPTGTERVSFVGGSRARLVGVLHRPGSVARGSVLLAHCFTCTKDIHTMTRLARALADAGYAAFRFDFTGRGESAGDFSTKTLSGNVTDVVRAATTLIERGSGPCGLVGHSLGGAAVLLAAGHLHTVRSVVTIGTPSDAEHVRHLFADAEPQLLAEGRAEIVIAGRRFDLEAGFVHDLAVHDLCEAAASLGRPYLIVHCDDDDVVPVGEGARLHACAAHPKKFIRYPAGGHLFADPAASAVLAADIVDWFDETLDPS